MDCILSDKNGHCYEHVHVSTSEAMHQQTHGHGTVLTEAEEAELLAAKQHQQQLHALAYKVTRNDVIRRGRIVAQEAAREANMRTCARRLEEI